MHKARIFLDRFARRAMFTLIIFAGMLVFLMAIGLYIRSRPILTTIPLTELLCSSSWHPLKGEFGLLAFLVGTLWITGVSIAVAVPFSILCAIHLSEYASKRIREAIKPLIDLLAGIPSVVYGVCGVLIIVPLIKNHLAPIFGTFSSGYSVLAGGLVLAVMIFPIIIHVSLEVFSSVPNEVREASHALGATKWQTVKLVVVRKAMPGVIAAIVLGLSRAFGETMAVLMVAGNVARIPSSVLDPAYPLPALIANNYGEMLSVPLYDSALLLASLILLLVVLLFNMLARLVLIRVEKEIQ